MTNPSWPVWLDSVWAKGSDTEGKAGESLAKHTWQVLQRFADMTKLRPCLPGMVAFPGLWRILFWACFLHDFGKAAEGFQKMLRTGLRWPHRHEVLSLAFINWFERYFSREETQWLAAAIAFHHKDSQEISLLYMGVGDIAADSLSDLVAEIDSNVLEGLWRWLKECSLEWIRELGLSLIEIQPPELVPLEQALRSFTSNGADNILAHLRSLRRWEREMVRPGKEALTVGALAMRGHILSCDHTASAHVGPYVQPPLKQSDELLNRLGLLKTSLYFHQQACMQTRGSAILIAPTGSGKTEAALLWACSQSDNKNPIPRLFYTLPYQASMNAMYDRLRKVFLDQVSLEHSRSMLAYYHRLLTENYDRRQATIMSRTLKNLARLHYSPIKVFSPYQMLKGPYRLKGYEALLTDFIGAAFVFDEIHAYDITRLAAILATIKYLREKYGSQFLIMSATLPTILQKHLKEALGQYTLVQASPELFQMFQRHRLIVNEGELLQTHYLEQIVKDSKNGLSVLVCCNTVKRAQLVYYELLQRVHGQVEVVLLHSRFNGRDRLKKEMVIHAATGSNSTCRRPIILVATQVVEVSLDIDLDVFYSDPAPLEALIQRFGRINRRRLKKWAVVNVFTKPDDGQHVYESGLVLKSLEILRKNDGNIIDEAAISCWLDEIYSNDIAEKWEQIYEEASENFTSACINTLRPFATNDMLAESFYRAFDSIEVLPACLENEYLNLMAAGEPLEANQLSVSLSWGKFYKLQLQGAVRNNQHGLLKVIDLPYRSEVGLETV